MHPRAGFPEQYAHEVFSRIAAQGHYVVWVCHHHGFRFGRKQQPTECVDGIHLARLGARPLFRYLAPYFLTRLAKHPSTIAPFNAIVDCITSAPLPIADRTAIPIVPLVYRLHRKVRPSDHPPGPIIAASDEVHSQLCGAGVPQGYIVRVPNGPDADSAAWDRAASLVLATIENLAGLTLPESEPVRRESAVLSRR